MLSSRVAVDRRTALAAAAAVAAGLVLPSRAGAFKGWCRTDPVIAIDGELADILVAVDAPLEMLASASGPVDYVVTLPRGVEGVLILKTVGFGRGERLRFETSRRLKRTRGGIEIRVSVEVPAVKDLPLALEFAPRVLGLLNPERVVGRTNERVVLETRF